MLKAIATNTTAAIAPAIAELGEITEDIYGQAVTIRTAAAADLARRAAPATVTPWRPPTKMVVADLEFDLLSRGAKRAGQRIYLRPREADVLELLMHHAGHVVTRTMLLEGVWNYHFDPQTNLIDVQVHQLRKKVDKPFPSPMIHTIRGAGWLLWPERP